MSIGMCLHVHWYQGGRLVGVCMMVWRGDIVARYLHYIQPSRRDCLHTVALIVWRSDWGY